MKVAIIGAGLAGLTCALELEKYGIKPVIYEKNNYIGEMHPHTTAILDIIARKIINPEKDVIKFFENKLDKYITPLNPIYTITHYSPNGESTINGHFGYFIKRGREKDSIKNQLYSQLKKTKVIFNNFGDYKKLSKEYDYVVIATGNLNFTKELGCTYSTLNAQVRGAIVLGNFDPNRLAMWINRDYCKNGYGYFTPFNNKRASLLLVVNDVNEKQIDYYWEKFLFNEGINFTIVEEFKLKHQAGYVYPSRVGNVYMVGNSRGGIEPFLGFGQMNSITAGTLVARAIVEGKDYDKLLKNIDTLIRDMVEFRKAFNKVGNTTYDFLVSATGLPIIKQLVYDTSLNVAGIGGSVLGLVNRISKNME